MNEQEKSGIFKKQVEMTYKPIFMVTEEERRMKCDGTDNLAEEVERLVL